MKTIGKIKRTLSFALIVSLGEFCEFDNLYAQGRTSVRNIELNNPLRRELLGKLRQIATADLGNPVVFKVKQMRVAGDLAFVAVNAERPNGVEIVPQHTPIVRKNGASYLEFWDCCHMEALFKRRNGSWKIDVVSIGSTDVWWVSLCDRTPTGLIDECKFEPTRKNRGK